MVKTKQLRQVSTGRIFTWTPTLAKRTDMHPHPPVTRGGLVEPDSNAQIINVEYREIGYKVEKGSVEALNRLCAEHEDIMDANRELQKRVEALSPKSVLRDGETVPTEVAPEVVTAEEEPEPELTDAERMGQLVEACRMLDTDRDDENFATSGLPKVQALEGAVGFNITAIDRNDAWEFYKKLTD